jgi:hypothetical protein
MNGGSLVGLHIGTLVTKILACFIIVHWHRTTFTVPRDHRTTLAVLRHICTLTVLRSMSCNHIRTLGVRRFVFCNYIWTFKPYEHTLMESRKMEINLRIMMCRVHYLMVMRCPVWTLAMFRTMP